VNRRAPLALLLVLAAATAHARGLGSHTLDRVASACVLVQVSQGGKGASGSGFFISRNQVVTNEHVVRPAIDGEADITLVIGGGTKAPKVVQASLVAVDKELDLALLRADYSSRASLSFEAERRLRVTDPVWVVGFPFGAQPGLEPTVTAGTISSLRKGDGDGLRQVQLDAAVNRGNSGGPVINALGKVIGVTRAVVNPKVGSGMALAIPCGAASEFVEEGKKKRQRKAVLRVRGRVRQPGVRIVRCEKTEEAWGTAARFTVRGSRDAGQADPLGVEFTDRRREVLHRDTLDISGLDARQEKVFIIRLKGVDFADVAGCEIED